MEFEFDPVKSEANRDKQNRFQGGVVGQATPIQAREHFLVTPMKLLRASFCGQDLDLIIQQWLANCHHGKNTDSNS
jgi:hypothetical protein